MTRKKAASALGLRNWSDLELFLRIVREGSFTKAANHLGIEQSTVSRRMAQLEGELGIILFERHKTRSSLTPLGERLAEQAFQVEREVIAFTDTARGAETKPSGRVRVTTTESMAVTLVIPRVLPRLRNDYPEIEIDLHTGYEAVQLGQREAEIALRFFRTESGDHIVQKVATLTTAWIAHRDFEKTAAADLPLIEVELDGLATEEQAYRREHLPQKPRLTLSSYSAQIVAVSARLGAAILPRSLLRIYPELTELDLRLPPTPILTLWLGLPRSLRQVPRIDAVWTTLLT